VKFTIFFVQSIFFGSYIFIKSQSMQVHNASVENMPFSKASMADDNRDTMSKHQLKKQKHLAKKSKVLHIHT
jgi:hypothetical protein